MAEYNIIYHRSIGKTPIWAACSVLTEETESDLKAPNISVGERVKINKYENIFRKR